MGYSTGRRPWRSEPYQAPGDASYATKQKLFYLGLVIFLVFGILALQLARMQLVNGDKYRLRAETNRLREIPIPPARGLIYDRNGVALVQNRASFAAAVVAADIPGVDTSYDPPRCTERCTAIAIALQELLHVPAGEIEDTIIQRSISNDPFTPAVIKDHLSEEAAYTLRERLALLPGVRVVVQSERTYTKGALLANILGFVGSIDEEEYSRLSPYGYQMADKIGKTGVEYTYESALRGIPGRADIETDASGRELRVLDQQPAKPGDTIILSIDTDLQQKVEEFVRAGMGKSLNASAVVINVKTGELLAMVSLPTYDNNIFTGEVDEKALESLLNDPGKPMLDHALSEVYPPGSTFKQVTGLAALQEGVATADTQITSLGSIQVQNEYNPSILYTFRDWAALGTLNFYRGVAMSSDVYFYYLSGGFVQNGKTVFQGLGADRLADWSRRFGLGARTGVDLPGESAGNVPDPAWKQTTVGEPWTVGDTYNFGIGQGYLTTTPLQMSLVVSAVANGGNVLVPHVIKEIRDSSGRVVGPTQQWVRRSLNIDARNIQIMREGMRQAVASSDGTARLAGSKYAAIAGKTGTAEFGERRPDGSYMEHGWFTGFGPFEDPEIAVVVFMEQGNGAGSAAPVAGKIFDYYFSRKSLAQGQTPLIGWRERRPFDYILLVASLALTCYGLLLIYSGSMSNTGAGMNAIVVGPVGRQLAFAVVGIAACLFVSRVDYRFLAQAAVGLYLGLIGSLLFVLTMGAQVYGSRRWIDVGGTHVQPSEIGKLIVILVLAKYLTDNIEHIKELRVFLTSMAIAAVPALLVFAEPDLGSAVIFLLIWLGMVIIAGADMKHVLGSIGLGIAASPFALIAAVTTYQRERVSLFLDPTRDAMGSGFNILQAEISVGSGGLFGKGLTHGSQTQLDYLRTQTTDYVFSVLGEELGFIGAMVLFSLFIILLMRGLRAAAISQDDFGLLVAVGVVIFILFQAFINIGVNIRLFPVTGIPLPFISQGGSSLITVFIAIGLLESVIVRFKQVTL